MVVRLRVPLSKAHEALKRAMGDYRPLLDEIGGVLKLHSQEAFQNQRFGEFAWPPRYFGRGEPFINVAGALSDLRTGPRVAGNRFNKRPALTDRGGMQSTVTWNVIARNEIQYGSPIGYAVVHQKGGESSIDIGAAMRLNLRDWLSQGENERYRSRLSFVFDKDEYRFNVIQRPFIGVTDTGRADLIGATEMYLKDALGGVA